MSKKVWGILLGLVFLNLVSWSVALFFSPDYLEVSFFDVGQGDAIFIETPFKHQILIDGGPDRERMIEKLSQEMPFWDRTIDLIILTHLEEDHVTGLLQVLKEYEVESILWNGLGENEEWKSLLEQEGASILHGSRFSANDVVFDVLNPPLGEAENTNDSSIVLKMDYGKTSFLFTGDISFKREDETAVDVDVLKVAHHGSKYSTSSEFLEMTSPRVAVIQVGKNSYGHPTEEVLTRLENFDIKILRNDIDGDVKIVSDGKTLKIISKKNI
ncbi:MAG: ComEC/Rec2 family competence protein [Candidatus Pacebacteria bacterium]|nr:ComEC/Rec2 family competence protein [Candidatus Paceibacterota bacterium]